MTGKVRKLVSGESVESIADGFIRIREPTCILDLKNQLNNLIGIAFLQCLFHQNPIAKSVQLINGSD